ncbi:MAG: hypothetical protein FJW35_06460, partial [Acidobacteria bacterium]|nr:hypothetical protein [Acidobacteriota bacterium]
MACDRGRTRVLQIRSQGLLQRARPPGVDGKPAPALNLRWRLGAAMNQSADLFDLDSERAVLGALLLEPEHLESAAAIVQPADFSLSHKPIYEAMLRSAQEGAIDLATVVRQLKRKGELDAAGGAAYVAGLTNGMPRGTNTRYYARRVREEACSRRALRVLEEGVAAFSRGNGTDPAAIIQRVSDELGRIAQPAQPAFTPPAHWTLLDVADVRGWKCDPLRWIVEHIFARGTLGFVAADSQVGKSLLMLHVALMMARGGDLFGKFPITPAEHVLYLALEDPGRRVQRRLIDTDRQGNFTPPGAFKVYVAPGLRLNDPLCMAWLESFIEAG